MGGAAGVSAQLLAAGLDKVKGDTRAKKDIIRAMEQAVIDSPRGRFTLSQRATHRKAGSAAMSAGSRPGDFRSRRRPTMPL